jgi:cytochrome c1
LRNAIIGCYPAAVALARRAALAQEHDASPAKNKWSFAGPFGEYDRAQLQRGLKVYREVCQVCHGMTTE